MEKKKITISAVPDQRGVRKIFVLGYLADRVYIFLYIKRDLVVNEEHKKNNQNLCLSVIVYDLDQGHPN